MRKIVALIAAALLLASIAVANASVLPTWEGDSDGPSYGGLSSPNVEYIKHVPISIDGVGGRLIGKYFYTNDQHKIMIFSVKDPINPELVGVLPMPQEAIYSREDIDTNGKIMVIPNTSSPRPHSGGLAPVTTNVLYIVDVEDKTNPKILAELPGAAQHTFSCILDCKWAYGSDGNIVDLRNPAKPKLMKQKWGDGMPAQSGHDVEEVRPGLVLTATQPIMLLDVRKDPTNPKLLAYGGNTDGRFIHSGRWAQNGKDNFLLMGGETNNKVRCHDQTGAFMTWDARNWKKTHTFKMIDEMRMTNGTFVDGRPAANGFGCSSHWLEAHPKFRNGGVVAVAFFEHGTRFMNVDKKGKIKEVGWFMPWGGMTGASYWITDEIVYAVDYTRGIDILRYTGKK